MLDAISELMEILDFRFGDRRGRYITSVQLTELASDIISSYVCPPSFLTGAYFLAFATDYPNYLFESLKHSYHPPIDSRLTGMVQVLDTNGLFEVDKDLQELSMDIGKFLMRKNIVTLSARSQRTLKKYNVFASSFAEELIDLLSQFKLKVLNGDEWAMVSDALIAKDLDNLSPVQLTCLSWMKRFGATKSDSYLNARAYFQKRKLEPKMFESNIKLMYNYYRMNLTKRIKKVGLYDICVDSN
jgi:hypothetical protein